jgi:23S rRNA (pseudouridine1915-N3)-methyltransferase
MRVLLGCVGRLKAGAERELFSKYLERAAAAGRGVGLAEVGAREVNEGKAPRIEERRAAEAAALRACLPAGPRLVILDEHGRNLTSPAFAQDLAAARDAGTPSYVVAVGGPDGFDRGFLAEADLVLALGAMTWPHQLARILAAEQIYRAITILAGHPYHRS